MVPLESIVIDRNIEYILKRGVVEVIIEQEMIRLLESGKRLRLKMGFDPSRPDIHLGHVVGIRKLRQFQELGHQVVLIVGDWTAQIGDPSGASQTRPMLSAEEVRDNAQTYMQQFFQVVDREKTELRWQSEWYGNFSLADVIKLTSKFTVAQLLARDDFSKRYASGRPIAVTELLYPLLQAYDSVVIESDVEFGGIDQKFNCLLGRELQQMVGQTPQQVFMMPLLVGTDGQQKMRKSLDNYIAIEDPPNDMYGKVMYIPDNLMMDYFELLTDVSDEELGELRQQLSAESINPMILKKRLAGDIVGQFHNAEAAKDAQRAFESVFQKRGIPEEIEEYTTIANRVDGGLYSMDISIALIEKGLVKSRGELKRLIAQQAIEVNGDKIDSTTVNIPSGSVVQVGKRRFLKILISDTNA